MIEEKRVIEWEEKCKLSRKRVKTRDLNSQGDPVAMHLDPSQSEKLDTPSIVGNHAVGPLDLNVNVCIANTPTFDDNSGCAAKLSLLKGANPECDQSFVVSRGIDIDLNDEDVSSSANPDPSYTYKNKTRLKASNLSECGSTAGPLEEEDPLRVWKTMKQNGYLSSSHGILPMLKQRGRKTKTDAMQKKIELAKREQIDRFTRIAAPSGLLNDLNPGIINHVRNRKQVHTIIKAIVRSEKIEQGSKQAIHLESGGKKTGNRKDSEDVDDKSRPQLIFPRENWYPNALSWGLPEKVHPMPMNCSFPLILEQKYGDGGVSMMDKLHEKSCSSKINPLCEEDILAFKLPTSTADGSDNASSVSNEKLINATSLSSLSVKAATVASQWLELLHQDIRGRLATLQRSKKRVQDVIRTELPLLIAKEFQYYHETDPYIVKKSSEKVSNQEIAEVHRARWIALFDQIDNSLSEEEKQLESWLNQVNEMQRHCEQGLLHIHWNATYGLQRLENESRSVKMEASERELYIQAAAASIYSTCNFISSKENMCC